MHAVLRIVRYLKGTTGHGLLFKTNGNLVTWKSKKQKVISLSSAEAEFRGIAKGLAEALWIRKLGSEIGFPLKESIRIMSDNKAAIQILENPVQHDKTKHVEIDRHFIKEKLEAGIIKLPFVKSEDQLADILTKAVGMNGRGWDGKGKVRNDIVKEVAIAILVSAGSSSSVLADYVPAGHVLIYADRYREYADLNYRQRNRRLFDNYSRDEIELFRTMCEELKAKMVSIQVKQSNQVLQAEAFLKGPLPNGSNVLDMVWISSSSFSGTCRGPYILTARTFLCFNPTGLLAMAVGQLGNALSVGSSGWATVKEIQPSGIVSLSNSLPSYDASNGNVALGLGSQCEHEFYLFLCDASYKSLHV
ncbi:hypothetical protein Tco_1252643 [Tanacetum coccineum]